MIIDQKRNNQLRSRLRRVAGQVSALETLIWRDDLTLVASQFEAALGGLKSAYLLFLEEIITRQDLNEKEREELKRVLRKLL